MKYTEDSHLGFTDIVRFSVVRRSGLNSFSVLRGCPSRWYDFRSRSNAMADGKILDLRPLVRPNILNLEPYRCARDDYNQGVLLDANECSFGPSIPTKEDLHRYPCPYQLELKQKIADWRNIKKEQIFLGVGSDEAIDMSVRIFCTPGKSNILITPPTYGMYKVVADINNIGVIKVPLTEEFQLPVAKVLDAVTPDTRIIFLCSPNNPTGNVLATKDIVEILESSFDGVLIVDEAYVDFSKASSLCYLLEKYPRLIILQTLSKSFGLAGVRFGMAIGHEAIIETYNKVKFPYNINKLTAKIAHEALSNLNLMQDNVARIQQQKERLIKELEKLPSVRKIFPSDSNFVLIRIDHAHALYKTMADSGVVIRYQGNKVHCQSCVRITVGKPEEIDQLLAALKKTIAELERNGTNGEK